MDVPNAKTIALGLALMPAAAAAGEVRLTLCPADTGRSPHSGIRLEDGRTLSVDPAGTAMPAGCLGVALGPHEVRHLAIVRPGIDTRRGLVLVDTTTPGGASSGATAVRAVEPDTRPPMPTALPVGSELIPRLTYRPFGRDERVQVHSRGDALEFSCRAGDGPAGIVLDPGHNRMPRGLESSLVVRGSGDPGFRFAVVPKGADAPQDAAALVATGSAREAVISAAAWHGLDGAVQFVVVCPSQSATLTISSVSIDPQVRKGAPVPRSAWMWESARWADDPERLVEDAATDRIGTLFVPLRIEDGQLLQQERLARFVRLARAHGISVIAVEGDPAMVLDEGRKVAVARAETIARYQRGSSAEERLAGVQYDIEPYLLPSFEGERERILGAWADTVATLERTLGERIDLVLPFWIADRPDGQLLLHRIRPHVQRITIMAYRTEVDAVTSAAERLLGWGSANGIPVTVGLEAGFVADEVHRRYVPASRGELHLVGIGDITAAVLLDGPQEGLPGAAFRLDLTTTIPGSRISFLGDTSRMMEVARETEGRLSAWSAFSGLAFHGLLER